MKGMLVKGLRYPARVALLALMASACEDEVAVNPFANAGNSGTGGAGSATARILVSPISSNTGEDGREASFTVSLSRAPTDDVVLDLISSDTTEGAIDSSELTFTPDNWAAPQTVTVTGVNDELADGPVQYQIAITEVSSRDLSFAALAPNPVTVVNLDDDTASILVSPVSRNTSESGTQATFTVVLGSQPSRDVTLNLTSNDVSEGTINPAVLNFTPDNWRSAQIVTVTGVDDTIADGDVDFSVSFSPAASADLSYATKTPAPVLITNIDNDSASIRVSVPTGNTGEEGTRVTFTVVLGSRPNADVTVNLSSSDLTEGTVDRNALTFTPENWQAPQTITVTGVDDGLADGNQPYQIVFAATTSSDAAYAAARPVNVSLINIDNDSAGIRVSAAQGSTTEAGGQTSFTVVLNSEPTSDVVLSLFSSNTAEGRISANALTFTRVNWQAPQTVIVTGVDDVASDGNVTYQVQFARSSSQDPAYAAITPTSVQLSNTDNDSPGITVSAVSGNTTEAGGTATFTVVLNSQPGANVDLALNSNDLSEGQVDKTSLRFNPTNWSSPQLVTIRGIDDAAPDGSIPYNITFQASVSTDQTFNGITPASLSLVNTDNDTAGFTLSAPTGNTTEAGATATFTTRLNAQPSADVILSLSSTDTTEGTVSPANLTFTPANWQTPQTVTATGVDDAVLDGTVPYRIRFGATTSADAAYAALTAPDVLLNNVDNDTAGFAISAVTGQPTEAGGTATFTIALNSPPIGDVSLALSSSNVNEGTVAPSSLTFTPANFAAARTVTVTGIDDALVDGNAAFNVVFQPATSTDANYNGMQIANVRLTNTDNDVAGFNVSALSAISETTSPGASSTTFSVALRTAPSANVTVNFHSSDETEATIVTGSLLFTSGNWNVAQIVQVTSVDDLLMDADQPFQIQFEPTASTDASYAAIRPADLNGTTQDNEPALTLGVPSTTTPTEGTTATFTVRLTAVPDRDVRVSVASDNLAQGTVTPNVLTFSPANSATPQTVTVQAVDNAVRASNPAYHIIVGGTVTSESTTGSGSFTRSHSAAVQQVTLTNADNEP
jgi:trimeric autotransporter adhesin